MEVKKIIEEIKSSIDANEVKSEIAKDLGLTFKHDKCLCFLHSEKNPSMAFDEKHKRFKCFSCGQTYDIFDHYKDYKCKNFIESIGAIINDFRLNIYYEQYKTVRKPIKTPTEHDKDLRNIISYLNLRKISKETLEYAGIRADGNKIVFEYRNELGEHIANKYRIAAKVTKGNKMWFEAGTNVNTLFNMDKINIDKPLIICEGEIDCLALIECGIKNAVSVPTGANSEEWIEANYNWLEQFKEVILWFDNDKAGIEGINKIMPRIPSEIVKVVKVEVGKDINEILYKFGKDKVREELKKAEVQDFQIENIINPYDIEDFDINEAEKMKSGIKELDNIIHGFVLGTVNILTGYNGGGKSTLINQMCVCEPISQGYKTFIFSGELTRQNLMYWINQTMVDKDQMVTKKTHEGKEYKKASDEAKEIIKEFLKDKLFIYSNDFDTRKTTLLKTMEQLAKRKNVKCFVLDNLMSIDLECNSNDELRSQKELLRELKAFANKYNAVIHLVAHPRKPNEKNAVVTKFDVCGSGDITNLSDYVTAMHRYTEDQKEKGKHDYDGSILLFKNRPTGQNKENGIGLYFSNERKRFYRHENDLNKSYGYTKGIEFVQVVCEDVCPF